MQNKPLPKITCNRPGCWKVQEYHGQTDCIHCGKRLNNWDVATQVQAQTMRELNERLP